MIRITLSLASAVFFACGVHAQSCYEPHGAPGCDDPVCEELVCNIDPFCCDTSWDETCVEYANENCGGGGDGDCLDAPLIEIGNHEFDTSASTENIDLAGYCDPGSFGDDVIYSIVWFKWECQRSDAYELSTCDQAAFDTRLAVFDGGCAPANVVACLDDTDGCAGFTTRMLFSGVAGRTYLIGVGGYSVISLGTGTLTLKPAERTLARRVFWTADLGAPEDMIYEAWRPAELSTTWDGCREEAEAAGDQLASITSAQENSIAAYALSAVAGGLHAFGLYQDLNSPDYSEPDGGWVFTDGTPVTYANWMSGEPNDSNGIEHVGELAGSGVWNDQETASSIGWTAYVTKRPGKPFSYVWPKSEGGNGHRYEAFSLPVSMTIQEAVFYANTRGGHLVTITSQAEQDMLVNEVIPVTGVQSGIAIGLAQNLKSSEYSEPGGGWEWVTGESVDYVNWNPGEPNDDPVGENFCEMYANGRWNDLLPGSACFAVIIEYSSDEPDCAGDVNGDLIVDGADLTVLLGLWGTSDSVGDLDGNGQVDGADLTILLGLWGACR